MPIAPKKEFGPLETDNGTGLPVLPEGLAWKVAKDPFDNSKVVISLVVRMTNPIYKGDELVSSTVTWLDFGGDYSDHFRVMEPTSDALRSAAEDIYMQIVSEREKYESVETLVGLYPPNSL